MTRNGVEYQLEKSPYVFESDNLIFYFSSKNHLSKFEVNLDRYIVEMRVKFSERYGYICFFDRLFMLMLYMKIETRGYYVIYNDRDNRRVFKWPEQIQLGGEIKIL